MKTLDGSVAKIGSITDQVPEKHKNFKRHGDYVKFSLSDMVVSYSGPKSNYAIIGFRKTRGTGGNFKSWFAKKHCTSLMFLNNEELMKKGILFEPWHAWEDLKICNEAEEKDLIVIKLNAFAIVKQRTSLGHDLYVWNEDDVTTNCPPRKGNPEMIKKLMEKFIKSIRISKSHGEPLIPVPISVQSHNGTVLHWFKDIEDINNFKPNADDCSITLIMKMDILLCTPMTTIHEMKDWMIKKCDQLQMEFFSVKSVNKPVVSNDFIIMHARFPSKNPDLVKVPGAHKPQTSNNSSLQKLLNPNMGNEALFKLIKELQDQIRSLQDQVRSLQDQDRSNQDQIAQLKIDNMQSNSHIENLQKEIEALMNRTDKPEKMPTNSSRMRKSQDKELQRESEQVDLSFFKNLDTYNYNHQPGL